MASQTKKTISIPSRVGSNALSETFGKITFTPEVKELLSALNAELCVRYIPGGEKPVVQVLSQRGKPLCTLDEFKSLSGYRQFVAEKVKELEKVSATDQKASLVSFFLQKAKLKSIAVPEQMLESNMTWFNQTGSSTKIVVNNLEVIRETNDNSWRRYLNDTGCAILRVLHSYQIECMGPEPVSKTYIEDAIFESGVPKWVYKKFIDKNFTSNLKRDCFSLLFPKNNFLKAISFTTKELQNAEFLKPNKVVLVASGGIIELARSDFSDLFPSYADEMREPVREFLSNYQWTLTTPLNGDDIIEIRRGGKNPPVVREEQAPRKKPGARPESDLARLQRQIKNTLNKIQGNWNSIMNFVIPVANPRTEFWCKVFTVDDWVITPTNSIYDIICQQAGYEAALDQILNPDDKMLKYISEIICGTLMIPPDSRDGNTIRDAFLAIEGKVVVEAGGPFPFVSNKYPLANLDGYDPTTIPETEILESRKFLGIKPKKTKAQKVSGASAVRVTREVLNVLTPIKKDPMYDKVITWLMTTFKTGSRGELQLIAAERILGEVLKHQGEIFTEFDEEEALEEIEDYYSSDED